MTPGRIVERIRHLGLTGYLLAVLAAACWATGALTAKWMFRRFEALYGFAIDPTVLSAARASAAFILLTALLVLVRPRELRVARRDVPFLVVFGVLGLAMVHFTYFKTISLTNVATAILLEYLAPVLVLVVSVLFLGERLHWTLPAAVALSVGGCALMVGAIGGDGLIVSPAGVAWGLASAGFFAAYTIMGKYASGRFSPWTLLSWGLGAATIFWLIVLGGPGPILRVVTKPIGLAAVVYLAVVATLVPFGAFLEALRRIDATKASVTATLEPGIAGIAAFLLFGETLTPGQLLGGAFVLVAILLVQAPGLVRASLPPAG